MANDAQHLTVGPTRPWQRLGPGLIAGAADDDPSGIATYSQAGAQFGYSLGWTMLLSYPLMAAVQEVSARIGRVTGLGLAGNLRRHYPRWLLSSMVGLLLVANAINLGADLGAMGAALQLILGGNDRLYVVIFGVGCAALQIFMDYRRYAGVLKWLTLSLFAYVGVVFVVDVPWREVAYHTLLPDLRAGSDQLMTIVAIFGTTISPYLFFWQSQQEVEELQNHGNGQRLSVTPKQAGPEIHRIQIDTYIGMAFSNLIAFFVIVTAAATLNAHGITDIQTSAQAAEALRPIAGAATMFVFAAGIIGTGLLAVPVLAGSAAYAVGEALRWPVGLGRRPHEAKAFYGVVALATAIGVGLNFTDLDPIRALFWAAVVNGVIAVPLMVVMMHMAGRGRIMGRLTIPMPLKILGWIATAVMAAVTVAMIVSALT